MALTDEQIVILNTHINADPNATGLTFTKSDLENSNIMNIVLPGSLVEQETAFVTELQQLVDAAELTALTTGQKAELQVIWIGLGETEFNIRRNQNLKNQLLNIFPSESQSFTNFKTLLEREGTEAEILYDQSGIVIINQDVAKARELG